MFLNKIFPFLLLTGSVAGGCCKKRSYCQYDNVKLALTGYLRSESRTVWVKRYIKGSNFSGRALDSAQFVYNGNKAVVSGKPDTLWLSDYSKLGKLEDIYPGNDYTVLISAIGKQYQIKDIADEGHNYEVVKCGNNDICKNKVAHFYIGGFYVNSETGYLTK